MLDRNDEAVMTSQGLSENGAAKMNEWQLVAFLAFASPPLWIFGLYGMARLGPWRSLAAEYPAIEVPSGTRYWFVSLQSGLFTYANCFYAIATNEHLTLRALLPFRPFHPAITFPRSAITDVTVGGGFWLFRSVSFSISGRDLTIYGPVAGSTFWQSRD